MKLKSNQTVGYEIDMERGTVRFAVVGQDAIPLLRVEELVSEENYALAAYKGLAQQRIVDGAAIGRTDRDGNKIPEATRLKMKRDGMCRIIEHLNSGSVNWEMGRAAPVRREDSEELRWEGVQRALGDRAEDLLAETMKKYPERAEALRYLSTAKRVAQAILELKAERVAPSADVDAMLDEFLADGESE